MTSRLLRSLNVNRMFGTNRSTPFPITEEKRLESERDVSVLEMKSASYTSNPSDFKSNELRTIRTDQYRYLNHFPDVEFPNKLVIAKATALAAFPYVACLNNISLFFSLLFQIAKTSLC